MPDAIVFFIGIMALTWFIWLPIMLVVTLITPKELLIKYFKQLHFNSGELIIFGSFPGFFTRTGLFCRLYLTPTAAENRGLNGFVEDSPLWFKCCAVAASLGLVIHAILAFSLMGLTLIL